MSKTITLTIEADSVDELHFQLRKLLGGSADVALTVTSDPPAAQVATPTAASSEAEKAKPSKAKAEPKTEPKTEPKAEEKPAISTGEERMDPAQEAQKAEEAAEVEESYDYNTVVMPLVLKVMELTNDRDLIADKIRQYGGPDATRANQVPADKMAAFVAEFRALKAKHEGA